MVEQVAGLGPPVHELLDEPVPERGVARLDAMVARRRLAGEPLQYVLGVVGRSAASTCSSTGGC